MKRVLVVVFAILFVGSLYARESVYVISPSAKLMAEPKIAGAGTSLERGAKLSVLAKEGMFYKVSHNGKTGYVAKVFTSSQAPAKEKASVNVADSGSQTPSARKRASGFSETASARGLTATEEARIHGSAKDYDFMSVNWLDEQSDKINSSDTNEFTRTIK
ncbi:MAG: hypothetical protein H7A25_20090 [Leptospiraceae bacterium]|nr:hypothetical protein [Leptospiraceae bacterium]